MITILSVLFLERSGGGHDWVLYVLISILVAVAIGRILFSINFDSLGSLSAFRGVDDNQMLFGIIFQISFAVLIGTVITNYLITDYDFIFYTPLLKALGFAVLILMFFGVRWLLKLLGTFALNIPFDRNYDLKTFNYYRVYSVITLWATVLLYYFTYLNKIYLFIAAGLVLLIIRALAFMAIFKNPGGEISKNWYYNILYICALEILPLLVLFKFLITE